VNVYVGTLLQASKLQSRYVQCMATETLYSCIASGKRRPKIARLVRLMSMLTRVLVAVHVVQVAGLLAQDHTVQTLVYEAVVVLHNLPDKLR